MGINARFIIENEADSATLTASPAAAISQTNLQLMAKAKIWRSSSTADQSILGDFSGTVWTSSMVLLRHNLSVDSTIRFRIFSGAGQTGTTVYDSGVVEAIPKKALGDLDWGIDPLGASAYLGWAYRATTLWFALTAGASFQLDISDPTNADGYINAARLFVGKYLTPNINMEYGLAIRWKDDSKQVRTSGGSLRTNPSSTYRAMTMKLPYLQEGEASQFMEAVKSATRKSDIFVSGFPGVGGRKEITYSMQAKFVNDPSMVLQFYQQYEISFEFEEI